MWWDEVWYFNKEVYWVDLIDLSTKIALGEKISDYTHIIPQCKLYWEYILPYKKWIIKQINIDYEKLKILWVPQINIYKKIWDFIDIPPNEFSFIWWFICKIQNIWEKDKIIENIKKFISITIE